LEWYVHQGEFSHLESEEHNKNIILADKHLFFLAGCYLQYDPMTNPTRLKPEKIIETVDVLEKRISERFPDSGLRNVCLELLLLSKQTQKNVSFISKPNITLRLFSSIIILFGLGGLIFSFSLVNLEITNRTLQNFLQITEGVFNNLIIIGGGGFFLVTIESRIKRKRALKSINELRVISHVIDMHQLSKDPYIFDLKNSTEHSPKRLYTQFELQRYLDYCSEASSLTAKVAALYAQSLPDAVIVSSVNEIEVLTTGLSRKIWQKIRILQNLKQED
jgi:hypothetical protein